MRRQTQNLYRRIPIDLNEQVNMMKEDIAGRLIKRVELISEMEQIEMLLDGSSQTHRNMMRLVDCHSKSSRIVDELVEAGVKQRQIAQRAILLRQEKQQQEQLLETLQEQIDQLDQAKHRQLRPYHQRLLQHSEKTNTVRLMAQFLSDYDEAGNRDIVRIQFVKFQKTMLSANKIIEIQRLIEELKLAYLKIDRDNAARLATFQQSYSKIAEKLKNSIYQLKQLEREELTLKVNEEIGRNELQQLKKQLQVAQHQHEEYLLVRVAAVHDEYLERYKDSFVQVEKIHGKERRNKLVDETRLRFYNMIKQQNEDQVAETAKMDQRFKLLSSVIQWNTEQIEKVLVPAIRHTKTQSHYESTTIPKDSHVTSLLLEDSEQTTYHRSLEHRVRASVDQRLSQTRELFKVKKKDSVRTECNRYVTEVRTEHSLQQRSIPVALESGNLTKIIKQLQFQTPVFKKSYASTPTFTLEGNLQQMGYAVRLLSLSSTINLQFRVGREPNFRTKASKVDQTVQIQRIRKIEKARQGSCFSLCLDRGVLDLVFRTEQDHLTWYNGLTTLLKNRALLTRFKGK